MKTFQKNVKSSAASYRAGYYIVYPHGSGSFLAKVMSVPFRLQGRGPSGFGKNLHASLRSGRIFSKNLACGGHSLMIAKNESHPWGKRVAMIHNIQNQNSQH